MQQVKTLAQFEEIVAQAGNPVAMRRLLEPLLPDGLPCCGPAALVERIGPARYERSVGQPFAHTAHCPTNRPRILLVH